MSAAQLTTWVDLIEHLIDWQGASPEGGVRRDARRASLQAYRDLATAHRWSYYQGRGRVVTSAPYQTGTVDYDHTGGSAERMLTLTGGTWPDWAAQGSVVINSILYEVASRISDSILTLTNGSNPGADLSAQSYSLIRDSYPLPVNLSSMGVLTMAQRAATLVFEHPSTWLERQRIYQGVAEPRTYCIVGSPDYLSGMTLKLWPPPADAYTLEMIYARLPRPIKVDLYSVAKASVTDGLAVVTGTGTNWTSRLVGAIFRMGVDPSQMVTGWSGENVPACERVVVSVESPTSLTLDEAVDFTAGPGRYGISDPVDVEPGAMLTCLLRSCEFQMSIARRGRDRDEAEGQYNKALILAREADSRNYRDEHAGAGQVRPYRLRDYPSGPDVS